MNNKIIGVAVVALIVGFGAGYYTHPSRSQMMGDAFFARTNGGTFSGTRGGAGMMGGGFLTGTIEAKDSGTLTLNTRDGSSHVVLINSSTGVSKTVTGAMTDVSIGSNVMVIGTTNSDGSISASMIQLRPATSTPGQ